MTSFDKIALVLSGGNALGAYQAGAYQALHQHGIDLDWVAGGSAGAMNGAIIAGNAHGDRLARLEQFWQPGSVEGGRHPLFMGWAEETRRTAAVGMTMAAGRNGVFTPRRLFGPFWEPFGNGEPSSLYDTTPLVATLSRLIDFDRLNESRPRFSATAIDLETGQDVVFDTLRDTITPMHLRASSALLPAFPPVEIDGRVFGDAGISANLPLDVILAEPPGDRLLCIAIDLLPLEGARPGDLGDAICRMQDLMFATQSRRALAAWQAIYDARNTAAQRQPSITVLHIAYADQGDEVSGKAFDFSPSTIRARWASGQRDLDSALTQLENGQIEIGRPGLTIVRPQRRLGSETPVLTMVRESLQPAPL